MHLGARDARPITTCAHGFFAGALRGCDSKMSGLPVMLLAVHP